MTKLINSLVLAAALFTLAVGFSGLASAPAVPASTFDQVRYMPTPALAKPATPATLVASR